MSMTWRIFSGLFLLALAMLAGGYAASRAAPSVYRTSIALPAWPAGAAPVTVLLMADIHLGNASMDDDRLAGIVTQANGLRPALIVLAGDFLAGYDKREAPQRSARVAAALGRLRAPLGVIAVLGNHDYGTDPAIIGSALSRAGITVVRNEAIKRGPLVVGGVGDGYSGNAHLADTIGAMRALRGARIIVTHSPSDAVALPGDITLMLAGHTHCGQVVLPIVGALVIPSVPRRYLCGIVREGAHTAIITAGLGATGLPLRVHAPPDMWLVTLGPRR